VKGEWEMWNTECRVKEKCGLDSGVKCRVQSARKHFGGRLAGHRSRLMEMRVLES